MIPLTLYILGRSDPTLAHLSILIHQHPDRYSRNIKHINLLLKCNSIKLESPHHTVFSFLNTQVICPHRTNELPRVYFTFFTCPIVTKLYFSSFWNFSLN